MKVKIKKLHPDAVIPSYSKPGDAGMDLVATSKSYDSDGNVVYGIGLGFEIPTGFVGLLFPRSSNAKTDLLLSNSVGVLDSGYRGEVMFKFKHTILIGVDETPCLDEFRSYNVGDRVGQIIILPHPEIQFEEVEELSNTDRGTGGFGSTGK
jgi:dUTP pyrophosphatase